MNSLIGRQREQAAIHQLLLNDQIALLTLTGPGGIGKTRLALDASATVGEHFVDGVYFVPLAAITDPALVLSAIADELAIGERGKQPLLETVRDFLADRQLLLILDNFEQVLAAAPLVGELLARCRMTKVLVTSRAALHLYTEQEFPVPPLTLPAANDLTAEAEDLALSLTEVAAVALFVQRAMMVKPDFALSAANARAVAELCIGLDGLPLAIELAAAKIKFFSVQAMLAQMQQRLKLLTGGPHDLPACQRTLRAEIGWSYDLLVEGEQRLFRRLSIFSGGFTLKAALAVVDGDSGASALSHIPLQEEGIEVADRIAALVDQSLLKQMEQNDTGQNNTGQNDAEQRFTMLETIREFGVEQLEANGERELTAHRHACFFLEMAETLEPGLRKPGRRQLQALLELELDNFRAAILWLQTPSSQDDHDQNKVEMSLRLAAALAYYAKMSHHCDEVRGWLLAAQQRATETAGCMTATQAKALWGAGLLTKMQGDFPTARAKLEESAALWRTVGDGHGLAITLCDLCQLATFQNQFADAIRYGEEGVAVCKAHRDEWILGTALANLAFAFAYQGDYASAERYFEEERAQWQALGYQYGLIGPIDGLGWIAAQQGDYAAARMYVTKVVALVRADGNKWNIASVLSELGEALQRQGELEEAGNCYGEALHLAYAITDKPAMAHLLHLLGSLAQAQKQHERAARLMVAAAIQREMSGSTLYSSLSTPAEKEGELAAMRATIGERRFAAYWSEMQALPLSKIVEYATTANTMGDRPEDAQSHLPHLPMASAGLTAREIEVLRLLARGATYAQIAEELVISRRTVNGHLTSIYSKLGVSSRAEAARFAFDHHLA